MKRVFSRIEELIKSNPRGMTVSGISKKLAINRNTVGRYLDIMLTGGRVEMRQIGSAKLYSLSHRVPFTALMDASSAAIAVFNEDLMIEEVNNSFAKLLEIKKSDLVGMNLQESPLSNLANSEIELWVKEAIEGIHSVSEVEFENGTSYLYFTVTSLPTIHGDGTRGACIIAEDITDLKETRDREEQHLEFLEAMINSLPHSFYVIDVEDYTITKANKAARFGPLKEDSTCYELTHQREKPCDGEDHPCPIEIVKKTKKPVKIEHVHVFEDGSIQTLQIHVHPILDEKGNVTKVIEYGIDITEREKVKDDLRLNESRYHCLFENSPIPLWEEDFSQVKEFFDKLRAEGVTDFRDHFENHPEDVKECVELVRVLDVNRATMDLLGVQKKYEMLGSLSKTFERDGLGVFRNGLIALAEGRTIYQSSDIPMNVRGKEHVLAFQLSVPPSFEETLSRVYLSILDLTSHFDTLKALRRSEERFKVVFETISDGILGVDIETHIIKFANPAMCKMLGYTHDELIGMSIEDIDSGIGVKSISTLYDDRSRDRVMERETDIPCLCKDGIISYVNITIPIIKIAGQDYLMGFFSESSRHIEMEESADSTDQTQRIELVEE